MYEIFFLSFLNQRTLESRFREKFLILERVGLGDSRPPLAGISKNGHISAQKLAMTISTTVSESAHSHDYFAYPLVTGTHKIFFAYKIY